MKKFLDAALLFLFFVGLASNFMGVKVHEAAGIIFVVGIIAHNILNRGFYKNFLRGKFNLRRLFNHATIILFAAGVTALAISGAALAEYFSAPNLNWRSERFSVFHTSTAGFILSKSIKIFCAAKN